jgi:hypothetical protein
MRYRFLPLKGRRSSGLTEISLTSGRRSSMPRLCLEEFSGPPPDADSVLDFYTEVTELVQGRIEKADGARELHDALSTVLAGLWAEYDDDALRVSFELLDDRPSLEPLVKPGHAPSSMSAP